MTTTRLCGVLTLLSAVLGLAAVPIAIRIGYPLPTDFGDAATLFRIASIQDASLRFGFLQILLPSLALCGAPGYYYLLRGAGSTVPVGVALMCVGWGFTTAQDGIEVALVHALPPAFAAADAASRPALLAVGELGTTALAVFGRLGTIGYFGLLLVNAGLWTTGRWRPLAGLYFIAFAIGIPAGLFFTMVPALGIGMPIFGVLLRIYMAAMGMLMIRGASIVGGSFRGAGDPS
jgi:hypothetical protein